MYLSGLTATAMVAVACGVAAAQPPSPPAAPPEGPSYSFSTGAGMLLFYVHPERSVDFEAVVGRLQAVLDAETDPVRQQQAAGWHVFKGAEPVRDAAIYFFVFDPAVPSADYDPVKLLGEAVPADVQALYDRLKLDVIRVERLGLRKLR